MKKSGRILSVVVILGVSACGGGPSPSAPEAKPPLTYYRDIKPIVDGKCTTCHVVGGIASFPLTSVDDVVTQAGPIRAATSARRLPPWLAAPGCQTYTADSSLSDELSATGGITSFGPGTAIASPPSINPRRASSAAITASAAARTERS